MTDEFDEIEPGRRSGAHRQESAASSNVGAISLVIILALVAVLLVVAAINIIFSSMGNPESKIADPPASESASAEPSPSESEVSVADDSITVDVLNGSGVSGAAKKFSEAVEEKGWTLGQVGNYSTDLSDCVLQRRRERVSGQARRQVAGSLRHRGLVRLRSRHHRRHLFGHRRSRAGVQWRRLGLTRSDSVARQRD